MGTGREEKEREGAWREAGVLNSRVKPPLWPIHEWNGTSGREWGRKQLWSVTFPTGVRAHACVCASLFAKSVTRENYPRCRPARVKKTRTLRKRRSCRDYRRSCCFIEISPSTHCLSRHMNDACVSVILYSCVIRLCNMWRYIFSPKALTDEWCLQSTLDYIHARVISDLRIIQTYYSRVFN